MKKILIGNAFPLSLISRSVRIDPVALDELKAKLANADIHSFWGHGNTVALASEIVGTSLEPFQSRPAIALDEEGLPRLDGISFSACWVLSPEFFEGFRPGIGEEVSASNIIDWKVLKITWL